MTLNELIESAIALKEKFPEVADRPVMIYQPNELGLYSYNSITMADIGFGFLAEDDGFDWNGEGNFYSEEECAEMQIDKNLVEPATLVWST